MWEHYKGPDSFWAPFFDVFPYPHTVFDWSPAELAELQDGYDAGAGQEKERRGRQCRSGVCVRACVCACVGVCM